MTLEARLLGALRAREAITAEQLEQAEQWQRDRGGPLAKWLIEAGCLPRRVLTALCEAADLGRAPLIELARVERPPQSTLNAADWWRLLAVPFAERGEFLRIAVAYPDVAEEIRAILPGAEVFLALETDVRATLERVFGPPDEDDDAKFDLHVDDELPPTIPSPTPVSLPFDLSDDDSDFDAQPPTAASSPNMLAALMAEQKAATEALEDGLFDDDSDEVSFGDASTVAVDRTEFQAVLKLAQRSTESTPPTDEGALPAVSATESLSDVGAEPPVIVDAPAAEAAESGAGQGEEEAHGEAEPEREDEEEREDENDDEGEDERENERASEVGHKTRAEHDGDNQDEDDGEDEGENEQPREAEISSVAESPEEVEPSTVAVSPEQIRAALEMAGAFQDAPESGPPIEDGLPAQTGGFEPPATDGEDGPVSAETTSAVAEAESESAPAPSEEDPPAATVAVAPEAMREMLTMAQISSGDLSAGPDFSIEEARNRVATLAVPRLDVSIPSLHTEPSFSEAESSSVPELSEEGVPAETMAIARDVLEQAVLEDRLATAVADNNPGHTGPQEELAPVASSSEDGEDLRTVADPEAAIAAAAAAEALVAGTGLSKTARPSSQEVQDAAAGFDDSARPTRLESSPPSLASSAESVVLTEQIMGLNTSELASLAEAQQLDNIDSEEQLFDDETVTTGFSNGDEEEEDPFATQPPDSAGGATAIAHGGSTGSLGELAIDGYTLKELLGEGGMAEVYRAQDRKRGRDVALKILSPSLTQDPGFVERFRREIRACASLDSTHIVKLFDAGESNGYYFMSTELVDAGPLRDLTKDLGAIPSPIVVKVAAHMLSALCEAHQQGIVHRDIKPGNLLLDATGVLKLADFGIAKSKDDASITQTGALFGTPAYMSPEQALGRALDARSDLFSAGIILREMLVGRNPFLADSPSQTLFQVSRAAFAPLMLDCPGLSRGFADIVESLTHREPLDRVQSADEALAALAPIVQLVDVLYPDVLGDFIRDQESCLVYLRSNLAERFVRRSEHLLSASQPRLFESAYWLHAATKISPDTLNSPARLEALGLDHGLSFGHSNDPQIAELEAAIDDNPGSPADLRRLADLYQAARNVPFAAAYLREYTRQQLDDGRAASQLDQLIGHDRLAPLSDPDVDSDATGFDRPDNSDLAFEQTRLRNAHSSEPRATHEPEVQPAPPPRPAADPPAEQPAPMRPAMLRVGQSAPMQAAPSEVGSPTRPVPQPSGGTTHRPVFGIAAAILLALLAAVAGAVWMVEPSFFAALVSGDDGMSFLERRQQALLNSAKKALAAGEATPALESLNKLVNLDSGSGVATKALLDRGKVHLALHNESQARKDLGRIVTLFPAGHEWHTAAQKLLDGMDAPSQDDNAQPTAP